jgi:hypothetical protein
MLLEMELIRSSQNSFVFQGFLSLFLLSINIKILVGEKWCNLVGLLLEWRVPTS